MLANPPFFSDPQPTFSRFPMTAPMKRDESKSLDESPVLKTGTGIGIGTSTGDPCCIGPELNGSVHGVRFEEVASSVKDRDRNGVVVYRRNKRLKRTANVDGGESTDSKCNSGGKVIINDETEGVKEMVEVEVKEESTLTVNCATVAGRRLTRSVLKLNVEPLDMSNENLEALDGKLSTPAKQPPEMEISKKISIIGRPTTVKELFETGLLEGYPVFYNGGKRVMIFFLLRINSCMKIVLHYN